ncbi:MAG: S-layer homology domain-containing protein [Defluviitaleaceae bacterium]|nr:S-layer homology domain-containing protein [Defluviitaleaceae bacterium]
MKKLSAFLAGIFIFASFAPAYAQVTDYFVFNTTPTNTFVGQIDGASIINNAQFNDIQGHWANESIVHGASLGLLPFGGANFSPNTTVTFQEGLAIAVNLMGLGDQALQTGLNIIEDTPGVGVAAWTGTLEDTLYLGFLALARDNDIIADSTFNALLGMPLWDQAALDDLLAAMDETAAALVGEEDPVAIAALTATLAAQTAAVDAMLSVLTDEFFDAFLDPFSAVQDGVPNRFDLISRGQMAMFIGRAIAQADGDVLAIPNQPRDILAFNDWQSIAPTHAQYVEALVRLNAMGGIGGGLFAPAGTISRAEVAQIIRNLDHIYYDLNDITRQIGTVAGYRDNQQAATLQGESLRNYYIRRFDGDVDIIQHRISFGPTGLVVDHNTPVFRQGTIGGMDTLQINDQIEYLTQDDVVLFINVIESGQNLEVITARLMYVDIEEGTIIFRDDHGNDFLYNMTSGMFGEGADEEFIFMDDFPVSRSDLPFGAFVEATLVNNIVTRLSFVGQPELLLEMRGIIIDNNPAFGYLTFIDNNGNIVTRFYNQNDMVVQRQGHYQQGWGPGYIVHMFPYFAFNPLAAHISDLQPGDIVFMRFDEQDPTVITSISATVHPVVRHGLVRQVSFSGGVASILLQFDTGQTSWFDLGPNVFITRQGRPVNNSEILVGDRLRLLLNQAVLAPGHVIESVLEASLEGEGHHISTILTGHLAGINNIQQNLMLHNSRPLTGLGWGHHAQIQDLSLSRQNIAFFHEDQQISIDHAQRFLSRTDLNTYVAMDSSHFGEAIRQITFRNGRDELLDPDVVISTTGGGGFLIGSIPGIITTDDGTIVRRNGRQVSGNDILPGDMVHVSLNGGNNAAVVDIIDVPAVSALSVARARVLSVTEGHSFTVQSMATLQGYEWMFTPVERIFTINPNTLFLNEGGWVSSETFIGFTADTVVDQVFTIVYDGAMATHVIDAPFGNRAVRGTVFQAEEDVIGLRDAQFLYSPDVDPTHEWRNISNVNPTMGITLHPNTLIVRNSQVAQPRDIQPGDQITVLTFNFPDEMTAGMVIPGYIVLVGQ